MKYNNIDACWEALDEAVKRLNKGETTLEEIVHSFELVEDRRENRDGSISYAYEPRWGWPIEFHPSVGYYLCY